MLRTKLVLLSILITSTLNADVIGGAINSAIGNYTDRIGVDSFLSVGCSDLDISLPAVNNIRFTVGGCPIEIDLQNAYEGVEDVFENFLILKDFQSHSDIQKNNPYDIQNYVEVRQLPNNLLKVEEKISKISNEIASIDFLYPKNAMSIRKQISAQVKQECSNSSGACTLSKSLKLANKKNQTYKEKRNSVLQTEQKIGYVSLLRDNTVNDVSSSYFNHLPVEKKIKNMKDNALVMSMNTASEAGSVMVNKSIDLVFEKFSVVLARSILKDNSNEYQSVTNKANQEVDLP